MDAHHPDSAAIDAMGGATAVASIFNISPQAVSQWRRKGIPRVPRMYLGLKRPDLFPPPAVDAERPTNPIKETVDAQS